MVGNYTPERGDIIWLQFNPQAGHEQARKRPALVISPAAYNAKTHLLIVCPVTSRIKGYPFEVKLPASLPVQGAVLSDQVKSLDWQARCAEFACHVPDNMLEEVVSKLRVLLD